MRTLEFPSTDAPRELGNVGTLRRLFEYLWPKGQPAMRVRVVLAVACLVLAKVAVIFVPLFYRDAVDALGGELGKQPLAIPVGIILAYGAARVLSLAFGELRDAVFARVGQRAIRTIAGEVFAICTRCPFAFTSSARPAGYRASSNAARGRSRPFFVSACSAFFQRWSRYRWFSS